MRCPLSSFPPCTSPFDVVKPFAPVPPPLESTRVLDGIHPAGTKGSATDDTHHTSIAQAKIKQVVVHVQSLPVIPENTLLVVRYLDFSIPCYTPMHNLVTWLRQHGGWYIPPHKITDTPSIKSCPNDYIRCSPPKRAETTKSIKADERIQEPH